VISGKKIDPKPPPQWRKRKWKPREKIRATYWKS